MRRSLLFVAIAVLAVVVLLTVAKGPEQVANVEGASQVTGDAMAPAGETPAATDAPAPEAPAAEAPAAPATEAPAAPATEAPAAPAPAEEQKQ